MLCTDVEQRSFYLIASECDEPWDVKLSILNFFQEPFG